MGAQTIQSCYALNFLMPLNTLMPVDIETLSYLKMKFKNIALDTKAVLYLPCKSFSTRVLILF